MSATVVPFPEPRLKPDIEKIMPFLRQAGDDPCKLIDLARLSLAAISYHQEKSDDSLRAAQAVMNAATLAYLAMGTVVGAIEPSGVDGAPPG